MLARFQAWLADKPYPKRSSLWPALRYAHLLQYPACMVCGTKDKVVPHHIVPVHVCRALELEPSNLISLCEGTGNHHLWVGHGGAWKAYVPTVAEDAAYFARRIRERREDGS